MKRLKTIFACMLMALFSIGQVWGTEVKDTISLVRFNGTSGTSYVSSSTGTTNKGIGATVGNFIPNSGQMKVNQGNTTSLSASNFYVYNTQAMPGSITKIELVFTEGTVTNNYCQVTASASSACNSNPEYSTSNAVSGTGTRSKTFAEANGYQYFRISWAKNGGTVKASYIVITYQTSGSSSPSLTLDPTSKEFEAEDNSAQVIALTASNFASAVNSVTCTFYSEAACTTSISRPSWVNEPTVNAGKTQVSVNVEDNDGAARQTWMKVTASDGSKSASAVFAISQKKYSAPTGTFNLFSGDLAEGDYVLVYATYNNAMKASQNANSNRIDYMVVSPAENKLENPDASIVWHIAPISETSYWTIYSEDASKYIGSTSSNNQAKLLDGDITDAMKWTVSTGTGVYDFVNVARQAASGNPYLRNNDNGTNHYGFACYANGTGGALTLYKKQIAGQPKAPTFSVPGGNYESAQSVELSCETEGAKIYYTLDSSTPSSTSTEYNNTAIPVSATTTIKAIAIKDNVSSTVASATYTIVVWQTVDEIWSSITSEGPTNAHIYGYVSQTNVSGYANNFYISDNGSTEGNQLYAYRMDMNSYSVEVGDKVKLAGDLTIHNEVKEFKYTNAENCGKVIALEAKGALQSVAVDGTPTKTEYAANEDFDPAGLKVYGTYANGFVGEITEGITWGNDLTDGKVTESTTVHVTATVSGITNSPAHNVAVTVAAKTLESIALSYDAVEVYQGLELPKPTVTATYSEGDPEDVTAQAVFTGYDASTTGDQEITVTYTFGGHDETANYTVTVNPIFNVELAASVARNLIVNVVGNTESTDDMIVRGKVSYINNASSNAQTYWISDDGTRTNEVEIFKGKYLSGADFTSANQLRVGDEVVVIGKVINYNNSTPEFANGKSEVQSHVRTPNFAITDVTALEVGATDLAVADLTINVEGEGAVTFANSDNTDAVTIVDGKLHAVAAGTATITANLAANGIYKAATAEFDVTVVAATVKYAITFDGNGADGGSAPDAISDKAEGAEVTLPANSYTKTGHTFTGWKVYDENEDEVTVTANAFEMPASPVTIKAQWAEISSWAYVYTSNVEMSYTGTGSKDSVIISETKYVAYKAGSGSNTGTIKVKLPYQTHTLHFHALAWKDKSSSISISGVSNANITSFALTADAGATGSTGKYTLDNNPVDQYFEVTFDAVDDEEGVELVFSKSSGDNRFIIYGVNQEGGVVPVLDHITISGDLDTKSGYKTGDDLDLTGLSVAATYTLGSVEQTPVDITDDVVWSYDPLVADQTVVTITATYGDETDDIEITLDEAVVSGEPSISTDANSRSWTVDKDAAIPESKKFTVTLKNITSATVTKGGDDPDAFSVTPSTLTASGDITVSVVSTATVGSYAATITIKDDYSETSKVVNVSLTVNEPETPEAAVSTTSEWVVAQAADLIDGKEVLITGVKDDVTYAMGGQNENNRAAVAGTLTENVFTPGANTMSFTLVAQETEGVFALRTSNGKYLYAASSGKNWLRSQADVDDNAKWTLSATSAVAESSTNRNVMQFNTSNSPKIFSCYAEAGGNGMAAIQFYVPKPAEPEPPVVDYTEVRNGLTEGWYYTMCLDRAVTAVKAGSIWRVLSKAANGNDVILEEVIGTLDAGRPYIFLAAASTLEVAYTGDAVLAPVTEGNNGLVGSFTEELLAQNSNHYIIYNNALYYVNSDNVKVGEHRAYLDMTGVPAYSTQGNAPGRRRVSMSVNGGSQVPTGVEGIEVSEAPRKVMINGQLFILRDKKMYDASGRLVK